MESKLGTYQTIDTLGKSQLDLILKVYDGAIGAFKEAEAGLRAADHQKADDQLERARRFMVHLYTTLNEEEGAEIAQSLSRLYTYLICQIDVASATRDADVVISCVRVLENLREGWTGIKDQDTAVPEEPEPAEPAQQTEGSFSVTG